jgi:Histidine kinase-, DNA gyrase B-, and HSP90-like ATPase
VPVSRRTGQKNAASPYTMTLDLKILDHLGINLYSNAAAVLSEAVANAWDADAFKVEIDTGDDSIVIKDDGVGMTQEQVNKRFLKTGYDKRKVEGTQSQKGRRFMGRKGIGKLALFSIANLVEVDTRRGTETNAFRMSVADIRRSIERGEPYHPTPIPSTRKQTGTTIRLSDLKKRRTAQGDQALRRRLARRFSIIGYKDNKGRVFSVIVDGVPIGPNDRDDLKAIEFLWEFGKARLTNADTPGLKERSVIDDSVDATLHPDWRVRGWIGAAARPQVLRASDSGSLHGIVVLARGRLIQENILDTLEFSRILNSYLTGRVEADFLDAEGEDDIATSDRQRIVEDDERYEQLVKFLRRTLLSISDQWTNLRNETRGREALKTHPELAQWITSLPDAQQPSARKLLGLIEGIEVGEEEQRVELFRSGVAAFERLRLREASHLLSQDIALSAERLLPLLGDMSSLEAALYRDIVKSHLDVIRAFEGLVDENARERVLQEHMFDNLWLLDPGWERATGDPRLEQSLLKEFASARAKLSTKERQGRVDIRYRRNAGHHIIVELKKADRALKLTELTDQGGKYRRALQKCLETHGQAADNALISLVFVVGRPVLHEGYSQAQVDQFLSAMNARILPYEHLISQARSAYQDYLDKSKQYDRIAAILGPLASPPDAAQEASIPK